MISVVIPVREGGDPAVTLASLAPQLEDCELIVAWDQGHGANWARNRGAERARGEYLLFSDDDIEWRPGAVEALLHALAAAPRASYSYGAYEMGGVIQCDQEFDAQRLRKANFISTMSLIRRAHFPGFDEALGRLQDWDIWLAMLASGMVGVFCGSLIFTTKVRNGITFGGPVEYESARRTVSEKHGLNL
jgi:glycosyltransferase involved in cell wall biosynthesis